MTANLTKGAHCTATAKSTGELCKRLPIAGATVCRVHGGAAPRVKAIAARRVAEAKARKKLGGDVQAVHDPIGELQLAMGRATALEEVLWRRLQDDAPDAPEVGASTTALDRLNRVLVDFERLGLEERAVRLQEQQGQVIATALQVTLAQLQDWLQEVVPKKLHNDVGRVLVQEAPELLAGELRKA